MSETLTVREAAKRLDIHENTVRNWMESGKLAHITLPSGFRRPTAKGVEDLTEAMSRWEAEREWVVIETIQTQRTWIVKADTAFRASRMAKKMKPLRERTSQISKETTDRRYARG